MFRRLEKSLPPDPAYPADLEKLGYFVTEDALIRKIAQPDHPFQFHLTNNDRHNEVHREGMQECTRHEVTTRLASLGLTMLYLPHLTTTKSEASPHVAILAPPQAILKKRKRVIVVINDSMQDLGILAYRQLQRELGINAGSAVNFAKELIKRSKRDTEQDASVFEDKAIVEEKDTPGLIILNCGQLYYSHKYNKAMTLTSWRAMPRKSIVHDCIQVDDIHNKVEGNRSPEEHIEYVFRHVVKNPAFVNPDAEIYVIGIENGAEKFVRVCNEDWPTYSDTVTAMALMEPCVNSPEITDSHLRSFLLKRARAWTITCDETEANALVDSPFSVKLDAAKSLENTVAPDEKDVSSEAIIISKGSPIDWLEDLPTQSTLSTITKGVVRRVKEPVIHENEDSTNGDTTELATGTDRPPICPVFSGGDTGIGECIFTSPEIYRNVLDFFEAVTQDPVNYENPEFVVPFKAPEVEGGLGYDTFQVQDENEANANGDGKERKSSWVPVMKGLDMEMGGTIVDSNMVKGAGLLDGEDAVDVEELLKGKTAAVKGQAAEGHEKD